MAPGPASNGMPSGTTDTSSRSNVSSRSWGVRRDRDRSPFSISRATPNRRAPTARSTMVLLGVGRSVLAHQFHPTATLVDSEVAVGRGSHEFVPGDDLELVAVALGEAQRARASHLARLEPLDGGDLPCVLERDFLECRHVSIPCSARPPWRRADVCTTRSLISVFRLSDAP